MTCECRKRKPLTPEQRANLRTVIADIQALREQVRAKGKTLPKGI